MTTLENRPKTALLVIDVQNGVVEGNHERDAVVANVGSLVERARQEEIPVVWVQHSSEELQRESDEWRIVPELTPDEAEPLVEKKYGDSFEDTNLETVLSEPRSRATRRRRRPDGCVHPLDAPRRVHQGVRRDPCQRCPHDGGSDGMGCAAAGPGDRAHEPVLDRTRRRRGARRGRSRPRMSTSAALPKPEAGDS